ncbi:phytanoyl-CoA dioxygenase family protein [Streptomyces sp. RB6PN25]|uniref:Phytanoyl-CoA dioxygenase family protein n=1 Tax=Streptomyces humicola TaxID=2953240 RepID=A0ABT1PZL8_9ACTN|nr:phytanoyl-CoA dioxygenase family protein [Streptomyces humicola]MCQ4083112.1 phytanoyl-CoA dioxygenase family protein [Streptomyces humicola]
MGDILTADQVERFVTDGFVRVPEAFPRSVAEECRAILWRDTGLDPDDPATWTRPVVRLGGYGNEPFRRAANTPRLHGAFDQLVGAGRWVPCDGLGTFPIRFPHPDDPGDAGWHMDASYVPEGEHEYWLNLRSRGRALLMLFLFSDVDADNAPTRIKAGSHLDVPPFLEPAGDRGMGMFTLCKAMDAAGRLDAPDRPLALATGRAGDVYLCHPFLIHAAQPHRGTVPRIIAQPPLIPTGLLDLDRRDGAYSPVERAVLLGLGRSYPERS